MMSAITSTTGPSALLKSHGIHGSSTTRWKKMKPAAAWIAPSTVRDPSETTTTTQIKSELRDEEGSVARGLLPHRQQAAADSGQARGQGEGGDAPPRRVDADRRGRDLAAAQRVEEPTGRTAPHPHHEQPGDREDHDAQHEERLLVREVDRADERPRASSTA